MEFSRNIDTEPMNRRQRARFEAVREVLSGLTKQVVHEPTLAMSDHYEPTHFVLTPEAYEKLNRPDDAA